MKLSIKLSGIISCTVLVLAACNTGTNTSSNLTNADSTVITTDRTSNGTAIDTARHANDSVKPTSTAH